MTRAHVEPVRTVKCVRVVPAINVRLPLSPPRPARFHSCRAPSPPHLSTIFSGALDGSLLGDLLHGTKDTGCADPIRELVSINAPAKAGGEVPSGRAKKAITC
jgi:hypothetical protein